MGTIKVETYKSIAYYKLFVSRDGDRVHLKIIMNEFRYWSSIDLSECNREFIHEYLVFLTRCLTIYRLLLNFRNAKLINSVSMSWP